MEAKGSATPQAPDSSEGKTEESADAPAAPKKEDIEAAKKEEPKPKKARVIRHELQVDSINASVSTDEVTKMKQIETDMLAKEKLIKETEEARNNLETYVYSIRREVQDILKAYIDPTKLEGYVAECDAMEEWLYTDEGFDSKKSVFVEKLMDLQRTGGPCRFRKREQEKRGEAVAAFTAAVDEWKQLAGSEDEKYAHITDEERARVRSHVDEAVESIMKLCDESAKLPDFEDPLITCRNIKGRAKQVADLCRPIMNRPKPKAEPKPAEKKEEEPAKSEETPDATKESTDAPAADADAAPAAPDSSSATDGDAMDVEEPTKGDDTATEVEGTK